MLHLQFDISAYVLLSIKRDIDTYRFIPQGVASQILLRDVHILLKFLSYEEYYRHDRW
jgi:hypothetical protein